MKLNFKQLTGLQEILSKLKNVNAQKKNGIEKRKGRYKFVAIIIIHSILCNAHYYYLIAYCGDCLNNIFILWPKYINIILYY